MGVKCPAQKIYRSADEQYFGEKKLYLYLCTLNGNIVV